MGDYLNIIEADYTAEELNIVPQRTLSDSANRIQNLYEADDGTVNVTTFSKNIFFDISLEWEILTLTETSFIESLWVSYTKANGREKTFYWVHPSDGYTYTVRFMTPLTRVQRGNICDYRTISSITLRVEGIKP